MGIIREEDRDGEDTRQGAGRVYESSRKQADAVKGAQGVIPYANGGIHFVS